MPVDATGWTILATGVRAEGIFCAKADSIWSRTAYDEIISELSSPYLRLWCTFDVKLSSHLF